MGPRIRLYGGCPKCPFHQRLEPEGSPTAVDVCAVGNIPDVVDVFDLPPPRLIEGGAKTLRPNWCPLLKGSVTVGHS